MGAGLENLQYNRAVEDPQRPQAGVQVGSWARPSWQWIRWKQLHAPVRPPCPRSVAWDTACPLEPEFGGAGLASAYTAGYGGGEARRLSQDRGAARQALRQATQARTHTVPAVWAHGGDTLTS